MLDNSNLYYNNLVKNITGYLDIHDILKIWNPEKSTYNIIYNYYKEYKGVKPRICIDVLNIDGELGYLKIYYNIKEEDLEYFRELLEITHYIIRHINKYYKKYKRGGEQHE